jgi:ADP-heptose:LPS heptosyltransferase
MTPEVYRERWAALRGGPSDEAKLSHLARQVALSFMDRTLFNDRYEEAYIDLLCEMATAQGTEAAGRAAASALFGIVVEGLCDDFEDPQTGTYNRVMGQVLGYCRRLPEGRDLDRRLAASGLRAAGDLLARIEALRGAGPAAPKGPSPGRILFLSRMTIGADVAVTSVLVRRLGDTFPGADLVLVGDPKLVHVFGGNPRLRFRPLEYARRGGLLERFGTWHRVVEVVEEESRGGRTWVVDPDSRLTQLGVLPVAGPGDYLFFNSRSDAPGGPRVSMSELANAWADRVVGTAPPVHPAVWLPEALRGRAEILAGALRGQGARQLVAVNLGVGGNPRKRIGDEFETKLLVYLLEVPKTVVVLDKGMGAEELERSGRLLRALASRGTAVAESRFDAPPPRVGGGHGVLALECGIGEIAALIARSDEFVGYDSAGQHIAAALGVSTCTVFAGSNNPRFVRRWRACGPAKVKVVHVDTFAHPPLFDAEDVIARVAFARETP